MYNRYHIYFLLLPLFLLGHMCRPSSPLDLAPVNTRLSFTKNPAGYWQVGYSSGSTLDEDSFRPCHYADASYIIGMWHPEQTVYYPYTAQNRDTVTRTDPSNSWALRPGEISMEGNNNGQFSMLRFIVPQTGRYHIRVVFEGVHFRLSSTDVHVLLNNLHLFDDTIDGYGGDPGFHAITGAHPAATYEGTISLRVNDKITFAVGYGPNKTFYNDTTGLMITIELV